MTRHDIISAALPLHSQRIAELVYENDNGRFFKHWYNAEAESLTSVDDILSCAFAWYATDEGAQYWQQLAAG